ncbi:hypothetical protein KIN20_025978 [Parelaphostrongylus tenuis]|uniref:Uncharacterized protein n=1 Tax=Parelaphostrongylus tenuis TaxID=148309 RepID=A0AAD5NC81_PARTN|nr:hypothetical protein KIN20_025978 [Parelaphostrongylus tenuis]
MARMPSTGHFMISTLIITTVLGCGVVPSGQVAISTSSFSGFRLPVFMVYSEVQSVRVQAVGIASSRDAAKAFVERLVMQTVFEVLEQQGRSALLSDAIISAILSQLRVQINYDPLECKGATVNGDLSKELKGTMGMTPHCVIVGDTVTATCPERVKNDQKKVECTVGKMNEDVEAISGNHTIISGTLMTTNVIMANWSKEMWQGVLNKAIRMFAGDPFATQFSSASGTVN